MTAGSDKVKIKAVAAVYDRRQGMDFQKEKRRSQTAATICFAVFFLLLAIPGMTPAETTAASPSNSASNAAPAVMPANLLTDTNAIQNFLTAVKPPVTNAAPVSAETNDSSATASSETSNTNQVDPKLASAIYFVTTRQPEKAEPLLVALLAGNVAEDTQKAALLELATVVRDENDLPRAQSIYGQYLQRWPGDVKIPEILLRQGEVFRQMGLNDLALGKFYSVMTSALSLKSDQLGYYHKLVLQAQIQIADTHYLIGQFADAADFYSRLLLNTDPALDRSLVQFHLVRSLAIIGRNDQAVAQAQDFLVRFPDDGQVPEVRYYLAEALKAQGQNAEALKQVLLCLSEQKSNARNDPKILAYWQQRVGNEIANQLYREGDFVDSLQIYISLAQLDPSPGWQIPADYQMGITYEKLLQPQKAIDAYNAILARQTEVGTNTTPALQAVFDMARWRVNFIQWQTNAESINSSIAAPVTPVSTATNNLQNFTKK